MVKLLIFASLISPSKILLFEEHQAFDTVFHHQMKHSVSFLVKNIAERQGKKLKGTLSAMGPR